MTEPEEVVPRPTTGPSSTSVTLWIKPNLGVDFRAEWPVEWRLPIVGDTVMFDRPTIGHLAARVTGVYFDHASGMVAIWIK